MRRQIFCSPDNRAVADRPAQARGGGEGGKAAGEVGAGERSRASAPRSGHLAIES